MLIFGSLGDGYMGIIYAIFATFWDLKLSHTKSQKQLSGPGLVASSGDWQGNLTLSIKFSPNKDSQTLTDKIPNMRAS